MAMATLFAIIDLTAGEIMIILVFGLIVLGPDRLPEVARTLGTWFSKARKMTGTLQAEMREVLDDPAMQPLKDVGEFVAQPRKKLTELALAAEAEAAASVKEPAPEPATATTEPETTEQVETAASDAAVPDEASPDEAAPDVTAADVTAADVTAADDTATDDTATDEPDADEPSSIVSATSEPDTVS